MVWEGWEEGDRSSAGMSLLCPSVSWGRRPPGDLRAEQGPAPPAQPFPGVSDTPRHLWHTEHKRSQCAELCRTLPAASTGCSHPHPLIHHLQVFFWSPPPLPVCPRDLHGHGSYNKTAAGHDWVILSLKCSHTMEKEKAKILRTLKSFGKKTQNTNKVILV